MKFTHFFHSLTLAAIAGMGFQSATAQVATDPVGFSEVNAPAGGSIVVPSLLKSAAFSGQAVIGATSVTPVTAPAWAVGVFNESSFAAPTPNYPKFYVEVTEQGNAFEGRSFDIESSTATDLTIPSGYIPAGLVGQTVKVTIRPHITLDTIAENATGLTAFVDAVNVFNSDGTTSTRYFDGSSWVAEDYSTPAGHTVIYPGTGVVVSASSEATFTFVGDVKTTKTAIPLYAGAVNFVGPLNPTEGELLTGANLAPALGAYVDGVNSFATDGSMAISGTYYSDGSGILDGSFAPLPAGALDSIPGNRGVSVTVSTDSVWVSNSPIPPTPAP